MPNSNGWGDGTANNTIGWGQGSINNTIGWGSAYAVSEAGLTDIIGAPAAIAPTNTVAPVISGTNNIGQVLTTTEGTWTGTPAPTFAYQWFRGATAISGQTATTYTIQSQDLHPTAQAITCQVTGTNASGTAVATSNIITPVILPFAFTAKTDNTGVSTSTQFKLPLTTSTGLNIVVDWGDASTSTITSHTNPAVTHTYASAGTYSISITGTLPGFKFAFSGDRRKILNISNWGVLDITTNSAFNGCTNLTCSATDAPAISTTDLSFTFANCTNFNGAIGNWDVSGVNNMTAMFASAPAFNQNIGTWDTSAVTSMFRMFRDATAFNQDISAWDVSQVSDFDQFMTGKTFSNYDAANLDAIYNVWSLNPSGLQNGITIEFNTIKYTAAGQIGKDDLIFNYAWTVNDGGI
jgi:surface protein